MERIGMFDAKTRFSEIVRRVRRSGKAILITSRGEVVAKLAPVEAHEDREKRRQEAIEQIEAIRRTLPPITLDEIRSAIQEGRR